MARHQVYSVIVSAVRAGRLREPFSSKDFQRACIRFAKGTYRVFLNKHRRDNPGGNSELFGRVASGRFELLYPIRYGL
jgi:hypothetical protein